MEQSSLQAPEKARTYLSLALQSVAKIGQNEVGRQTGIDGSTVSRFMSEEKDMLRALHILAAAGLKVVPSTHICVAKPMYEALVTIAAGAMTNPDTMQKLVWED